MPSAPAPQNTTADGTQASVPDDLTPWSDEQLSGLFSETSTAGDTQIFGEWNRREQAMSATVTGVPADLNALSDAQIANLLATLTSSPGTLDPDAVARVTADLERRDREYLTDLPTAGAAPGEAA